MSRGSRLIVVVACLWPLSLLELTGGAQSFASLASEAAAARDSDHLKEAVSLYRQALALKPDWAEGWWSLGTLQYDLSEYIDAVAAFEKLCDVAPKSGSGRIMLGLSQFELGRDSQALSNIEVGQKIGVADNEQLRNVALFHEGILLQRKGKFEAAQHALDSLCSRGIESPAELSVLGMTALRMQDRSTPSASPAQDVVNRAGKAQCVAARKEFDQALQLYSSLVHDYPKFPKLHYAFGRFLVDVQDVTAGIAELETEIRLDPTDSLARLQIAAAKYKVDSAGALPYARAAVQNNPKLPLGHYILGLLLLDTGNSSQAIPELETAQKSMSQVSNLYAALGTAYSQAGRDEDAARARAMLQKLKQQNASLLHLK